MLKGWTIIPFVFFQGEQPDHSLLGELWAHLQREQNTPVWPRPVPTPLTNVHLSWANLSLTEIQHPNSSEDRCLGYCSEVVQLRRTSLSSSFSKGPLSQVHMIRQCLHSFSVTPALLELVHKNLCQRAQQILH